MVKSYLYPFLPFFSFPPTKHRGNGLPLLLPPSLPVCVTVYVCMHVLYNIVPFMKKNLGPSYSVSQSVKEN